MDRLIDIVEDKITYPVTWELDPTNRCNHYCVGCYAKGAGGRTNNDHLTLKQAKNYVDQVVELNAKAINLTGANFVDINSGVEKTQGEKNLSLIDSLISSLKNE